MAAPKFSPVAPRDAIRYYESPDHVPDAWVPTRPGDITGFQPKGDRLGAPGPDQGFAIKIANSLRPKLHLQAGENADDVVRGCLGVALRRASMFSRAPVVHDLTIAFTVWGFYDEAPADELVAIRSAMFEGLRHVGHHYTESRQVVDAVPASTLEMTPAAVEQAYRADWRSLLAV
ncbi:hypothetical protein [Ilumatobacter coccineus]|jgi:hypothetical protein|uniref:Uncharacterized protein n=1 Tax=Ilumatobacter coccineus (strain NBRC 103263 / KCTC 29153 / YM16-304) TaxID=1313172 RepID=A0A6C7E8U0_ILUCY|nr:hypothetical protein [Ilumatobacter coccineus]BAN01619.1 hypothetical protein YM304_13050 [Ilumatobacter coccineus YM16-304]